MKALRRQLLDQLGESPTASQRVLVERVVNLQLSVARIEAKAAEGGGMSEHDTRVYLAWSNSLTRTLRALGLEAADVRQRDKRPTRPRTLQDLLAARAAS